MRACGAHQQEPQAWEEEEPPPWEGEPEPPWEGEPPPWEEEAPPPWEEEPERRCFRRRGLRTCLHQLWYRDTQ